MNSGNNLFAWQDSKPGLAIIAILDFFIAFIFVSLALSAGGVLNYVIAGLFLLLGIANAVRLVKKLNSKDNTSDGGEK